MGLVGGLSGQLPLLCLGLLALKLNSFLEFLQSLNVPISCVKLLLIPSQAGGFR